MTAMTAPTPLKGTPMLVQLKSLTKTYRAAEVETTALHSVNVEIREGEFVAVMGPSGCGKSTLLNIIGMLDSPTSGAYVFKDQDVSGFSEARPCLKKASFPNSSDSLSVSRFLPT